MLWGVFIVIADAAITAPSDMGQVLVPFPIWFCRGLVHVQRFPRCPCAMLLLYQRMMSTHYVLL